MVLDEVFERFADGSPATVMARAALEHALDPAALDALFARTARSGYTKELLFSAAVDLMALVVCKARPAVHAAYRARAGSLPVTLSAVYQKLARIEPAVCAALVRETAAKLSRVADEFGPGRPWLAGYPVRVLDGSYLARTEHRLKELRGTRAAARPGMAVVVLDPVSGLVADVFPAENGHAQERSLLAGVLGAVRRGQLWVGDRNFCTADFLAGLRERGAHFLVRQHGSMAWEPAGPAAEAGRCATGAVSGQPVRLPGVAGAPVVRRVVVRLEKPTRDGEAEVCLLTDLPAEAAPAAVVAGLYRRRWTVEGLFQELERCLASEVTTLGYPRAALFAFCVALVASNALAVVKAALRAAHGPAAAEVSGYHLAEEVSATYRGMMVALPAARWEPFRSMPAAELAGRLRAWAGRVRLAALRRSVRGPKKKPPRRPSCGRFKHVATAKLLAQRRPKTSAP
jgi:hypothetical protein